MSDTKLEDIVSLAKRRGFIYQGSEIYGGLAGTWDYGPLGVQLKRNIQNLWWQMFVESRDDMYGLDAAILMNQEVWKASGHVSTFSDPLVECSNCHGRFRADHLYSAFLESVSSEPHLADEYKNDPGIKQKVKSVNIPCPTCGKHDTLGEPRQFNMMFATPIGPTWGSFEPSYENTLEGDIKSYDKDGSLKEKFDIKTHRGDINSLMAYDKNSKTYLRPETAQGIFTNYKNVVDTFSPDLPFGIGQIGKAFRNEISPRDFIFRSREFEQMEIEYFIEEKDWENTFAVWVKNVYEFLDTIGITRNKVHEVDVLAADRAHYSKKTIDFDFDYPFGKSELLGLAYRTDYDLKKHQEASGKSMEYVPKSGGKSFIPHVIEPSFGVDRAVLAVLTSAYKEDEVNGEKRIYLKLPANIAPVKVAVSPLLKNKPELVKKAREVYDMLKKEFGAVMWDDNGNIGKRYRRQDEIGTPYCVTIDFDTLEDDSVTVRNRDTTKQERTKINSLVTKLKA